MHNPQAVKDQQMQPSEVNGLGEPLQRLVKIGAANELPALLGRDSRDSLLRCVDQRSPYTSYEL